MFEEYVKIAPLEKSKIKPKRHALSKLVVFHAMEIEKCYHMIRNRVMTVILIPELKMIIRYVELINVIDMKLLE